MALLREGFDPDRTLRRMRRVLMRDPAAKFLFGELSDVDSQSSACPYDDTPVGAGRSLPRDLSNNLLATYTQGQAYPAPLVRVPRWLVPAIWGSVAFMAVCGLTKGTGAESATPKQPAQPAFTKWERAVLQNPAHLQALGLCATVLEAGHDYQLNTKKNSLRATSLTIAAGYAVENNITCDASVGYVRVATDIGWVNISSVALVGLVNAPDVP